MKGIRNAKNSFYEPGCRPWEDELLAAEAYPRLQWRHHAGSHSLHQGLRLCALALHPAVGFVLTLRCKYCLDCHLETEDTDLIHLTVTAVQNQAKRVTSRRTGIPTASIRSKTIPLHTCCFLNGSDSMSSLC